jgi:hypothetical protein
MAAEPWNGRPSLRWVWPVAIRECADAYAERAAEHDANRDSNASAE